MRAAGLRIRRLMFCGSNREPALVSFEAGLNVIYGASNTGKSFIVDAIDFMLGGKGPLRDIPERVGYDRILLAMETLDGQGFTIQRSTNGGAFRIYDGLFSATAPLGEGAEYAEQHNDRRNDNLSTYLLSKIGLTKKRLRRNKQNDTQSLSFRNLARLVIINEEEIIQQRSPLSDGTYTADTANTSVFKLLLTGVDDSSLVSTTPTKQEDTSREAQIELLEQLIKDMQHQVRDLAGPPAELEDQLGRLDQSIFDQGQQLAISEAEYREVSGNRRAYLRKLEEANNLLTEIRNLLERFALLDRHYTSDLERLKGIEEAGSLLAAFGDAACPLCGALPEHHRLTDDCDGNVELVMSAAKAESSKIELRQAELKDTMASLQKEAKSFERRIPRIESDVHRVSQQIEKIVAPKLRQLRTVYGQLADTKGEVREALSLYKTLKDLEGRRIKLLGEEDADGSTNTADIGLSTSTVDKFAELILSILNEWHFPDADRVHFDLKTRDLVINGKSRISYGKGLRAITQAAFTIGLLEFCRQNETPHPGFVILDSPLLSYREPDSQADDLRGTDLDTCFYEYLEKRSADRQVIVIENTDPPPDIQTSLHATRFTGLPTIGRFGFFPKQSDVRLFS
jgi:predicted  nucleic acid-binding Zn-ribbon protein